MISPITAYIQTYNRLFRTKMRIYVFVFSILLVLKFAWCIPLVTYNGSGTTISLGLCLHVFGLFPWFIQLCELQCLAYFHTVVVAAAVLAFFLVVVFSWPKGKFVEMEDPVMGSKSWGNWTCMSGVGILDGIVTIVHRPAVSIVVSRSGGRSFMVASYPCGAAATTHALEYLSTPNC